MKKTYNSPDMKVVRVALHRMVAESIAIGNTYNGTDAIQSHKDNAWDIWGEAQDDEEDW